eukprot:3934265-Rhodomonas_salina.1
MPRRQNVADLQEEGSNQQPRRESLTGPPSDSTRIKLQISLSSCRGLAVRSSLSLASGSGGSILYLLEEDFELRLDKPSGRPAGLRKQKLRQASSREYTRHATLWTDHRHSMDMLGRRQGQRWPRASENEFQPGHSSSVQLLPAPSTGVKHPSLSALHSSPLLIS